MLDDALSFLATAFGTFSSGASLRLAERDCYEEDGEEEETNGEDALICCCSYSSLWKQRISVGKKENKVLEDEISSLIEKLNELKSPKINDTEARNNRHNFVKKASVLRREL
ncbi:unnamed protein product [Microthlaspi erraticum]|uniref:Uncharacterized protein n=1 Tax=Microthlaspi erraticum TaxID=1685480 RepID=A0A6D2J2P0_9BRAS|nr:unnamed protein product [Microthlaspi erraticum]